MSSGSGLRRQIILSMAFMALSIILLSVLGSYAFYAFFFEYSPSSISDNWLPSRVEIAWMVATTLVALLIAIFLAIKLSRRILTPLNSVAESLRAVAQGDLQARATTDDQSLGEAVQLVSDFNAMAERLQTMEQERAFWNAAIAHELRTPVTVLRGRLQGLTDGVFAPEAKLFSGLLRQVEGLSCLIEDLRVLSLNDSGHLVLSLTQTNLAQEIATVTHLLEPSLKARGFSLHLALDAMATVNCDPIRIRQALMALLENALKHADPGTLLVQCRLADGMCCISVDDDGPGIPAEMVPRLFDAFHRGDPSRSRQSGGSGLGLAVVKAIATAHGGHALCKPSSSGGTSMQLCWPA